MKTRFSRDARNKVRPGARRLEGTTFHYGDDFDEIIPDSGTLSVHPVRDYTPKVKQTWDEDVVTQPSPDLANHLGAIIEGAEPVITGNSLESFRAAVDKRANSQPDVKEDCSPEFQEAALKMWTAVFKKVSFDSFDVDDDIFDRWLSKFDDVKRERMLAAQLRLPEVFDQPQYLGVKDLQIKKERLLKRYDPKWAPRLIYVGTDEFNVLTGPIAMVIMERLVELFERTKLGNLKVKLAYKTNDVDLANFLRSAAESGKENCFEADFSANDLWHAKFMTTLFNFVCTNLGCPQWYTTLLSDMRKFTVRNKEFGFWAQLENQLPTGTTITTPKNCVVNGTIEGVKAIQDTNHGDVVILGDDFLGMFLKKVRADIGAWVREHARMKLTPEWPQLSGQSTLLSRRICTYGEDACMMPKLGKALASFNVRASSNAAVSDSAYMAGKALSYAYEFRHFPLFRDMFLERFGMEEDAAHVTVDEVSWFTRTSDLDLTDLQRIISNEKVQVSDDDTREFLMDAYGDDFGLVDAVDFAREIITTREPVSLTAPHQLSIDF